MAFGHSWSQTSKSLAIPHGYVPIKLVDDHPRQPAPCFCVTCKLGKQMGWFDLFCCQYMSPFSLTVHVSVPCCSSGMHSLCFLRYCVFSFIVPSFLRLLHLAAFLFMLPSSFSSMVDLVFFIPSSRCFFVAASKHSTACLECKLASLGALKQPNRNQAFNL